MISLDQPDTHIKSITSTSNNNSLARSSRLNFNFEKPIATLINTGSWFCFNMTEHSESKAEAKPAVEYDIRTLTSSEDDLERIWQMWQTIFPKWPIERERLGKLLTLLPGHHHIHDNGFCLCYLEGTHGKIAAVGVLPEHRGKGLGTTLLTKAHDELRSAAQANGGELEFLELGSTTPRFWAQMPAGFPQEVKDFFVHRGNVTEPTLMPRPLRG